MKPVWIFDLKISFRCSKTKGIKDIKDVGFQGSGCAISKSSASVMTTLIKGKPLEDAAKLMTDFLTMMTQENVSESTKSEVGRMKIFEGVKEFPVRVKCATLIWQALGDILKDAGISSDKSASR